MQMFPQCAIAVLTTAIIAVPSMAAEKPFVTVNGVAISQATADMFMTQAKMHGMPDTPEIRSKLREDLIRRELMFQAAKRAGFDKKPDVVAQVDAVTRQLQAQIEASKQVVVTRAFFEDYLKQHPVTDAQLKASYDANRAKGGSTEYKVRHILVKTEAEATAIIARLGKGEKFEELAQQSIDPGSKTKGGDLGWSSPAKFVPPFAQALRNTPKNEYSHAPVKSDFGYHVIKVDDTRPLKVPSFDEMKPMQKKDAEAMVVEKMLADLRAKAKIQ